MASWLLPAFDLPPYDHVHEFERGGKCRKCDTWCPHPTFKNDRSMRPVCTTCGCLKPLSGSRDFYEIPLGDVQTCNLGWYEPEEVSVESQWQTWCRLKEEARAGTFRPSDWNWAVGENYVEVTNPAKPEGYSYERKTCIWIMGQGAEQCLHMFVLNGEPGEDHEAKARQLIRNAFGVTRILNGVG